MRTFIHTTLSLLVILSSAGPVWSMGGGRGSGGEPLLDPGVRAAWAPLLEEGRGHQDIVSAWEQTVTHLAAAGLTPAEGSEALEPARQALREDLPAASLLAKLDEGAVKGVPADGLRDAAEKRLAALRQARPLLASHGFPQTGEKDGGLLVATALALESGLPESPLASTLEHGKGAPTDRIQAVVEAGEALYLDGIDPETVEMLMADCLDRQLRRPEVLRVVRFARDQRGRGLDGTAIRATLWGTGGGGGGSPAMGGPSGSGTSPGSSFGPGVGGSGMGGQGSMGGTRPPRGGPR